MNNEIVILPEACCFSGEYKRSRSDFDLAHEECTENHNVYGLLNEIEEVVDTTQSQKIKNKTTEKNNH